MKRESCIWCLRESADTDVEHIFPEALGCPTHLTLPGSIVCKRCNNGLAHLDQVVVDDFDFLLFMNGIIRKRGRAPEISNRGNVFATCTSTGNAIFFNLESVERVTPGGRRIAPYRGRPRDIKPKIQHANFTTSFEFEVPFGQDNKFPRGLYKIALNAIASMLGPEVARSETFHWLRDYVKHGGKRRRIMLTAAPSKNFTVAARPPYVNEKGEYAIEIRIAMAIFLLDLSPDENLIHIFEREALRLYGESGVSILPSR